MRPSGQICTGRRCRGGVALPLVQHALALSDVVCRDISRLVEEETALLISALPEPVVEAASLLCLSQYLARL